MKTEIIRHICDAGVLDKEGTKFAHPNVIAEAKRTRPWVGGGFLVVWLTGSCIELVVLGLTGASVELLLAEIAFL